MKRLSSTVARAVSLCAACVVTTLLLVVHGADLATLGGRDVVAATATPVLVGMAYDGERPQVAQQRVEPRSLRTPHTDSDGALVASVR